MSPAPALTQWLKQDCADACVLKSEQLYKSPEHAQTPGCGVLVAAGCGVAVGCGVLVAVGRGVNVAVGNGVGVIVAAGGAVGMGVGWFRMMGR